MAVNYHNMDQELNKADYIVRIIAYLIDVVIMGTFTILVNLLMVVTSYLTSGKLFWGSAGFHISLMLLIVFVSCVLYSVISVATCGATVGKYMMKIEVVTTVGRELTFKQIISREFIGRTLCKLMVFSGFAMMFYNEDGLGLHDKLSGTMVVKKGKDLMELAVGKEILRKALLEGEEEERYNRIYNRGINARLSGASVPPGEKKDKLEEPVQLEQQPMQQPMNQSQQVPVNPFEASQLSMEMYQMPEQVEMPQDIYYQGQAYGGDPYGMPQDVFVSQESGVMPQEMYGMPMGNPMMPQESYVPPNYEMGHYQEALQNVVDEHSLMEECQQHLQFYT